MSKREQYSWSLKDHVHESWAYSTGIFSKEECENIINMFKDVVWPGTVSGEGKQLDDVRRSDIYFLEVNDNTAWVFERLASVVNEMNPMFFNYDINKIETLQFTRYDEADAGFYTKHVDQLFRTDGDVRKLSFSILLSDPEDFEGGNLTLYYQYEGANAVREQGALSMFPSYTLHEVTPVTKGTRYALVGWVLGPAFK